ncbi:MAG: Gfo/Idh/MocA family oxidoreductase [Planctomycetaceae bacterium]|nr:Gfo/Idh/MocA family oxidoreductase [Planctomycetaceae bacterium]
MTRPNPENDSPASSRRQFMRQTSAGIATGALVGSLASSQMVHAAGEETIKVGLVGCGGRGSGAAINAMHADENMKLTVMADLFEDRLQRSRRNIRTSAEAENMGHKFDVADDHCFSGFDAYKQVMQSDVDVVILAATPHFRPKHLAAAIDAGKHVFCEKPVAVDGPGVREVMKSVKKAKEKNLSIVSGLCWRYDLGVRETVQRIRDGAIGDIVAIHTNYLAGTLWHRGRKPEWSEMEYQLRNWMYFTWLSGDHIVEQHIHSLDKAVWLMNDQLPTRCFGLGGRQVRTGEKWGNIYDHHAVCYEFDNGPKVFSYTRQMNNCHTNVDDYILGTGGKAALLSFEIDGDGDKWKYDGPRPSMYDVEHKELFAGLRSGNHINNGDYMARSTLMAIMGRMACYTGEVIEGEKALNSTEDLRPESYEFGDVPVPAVPMPGITRFS